MVRRAFMAIFVASMVPAAAPATAPQSASAPALPGIIRQQRPDPRPGYHAGVTAPQNDAFGFHVGEERRWVVEPEVFALRPGELVSWVMRLESIDLQAGANIAHFYLEYESRLFSRRGNIFNPDEVDVIVTETDLWVNERGFPLRVRHRGSSSGSIVHKNGVEVRWEDGQLRVSNATVIGYRDYALHVPAIDAVDMERPEGVFLSSELNPGLLALPFALASSEWARDTPFVALDPSPLVDPSWTWIGPPDAAVGPGGAAFGSSRRPPTPRQLSHRSLRRTTLGIGRLERVRVGGITTEARRVRVSSGGEAWIAPDGTVLRVGITMRRTDGWIRLLRPSEY